jgi:hypothetical protein
MSCTVAELLNRISSAEITEWMAELQLRDEDEKAEQEKQRNQR